MRNSAYSVSYPSGLTDQIVIRRHYMTHWSRLFTIATLSLEIFTAHHAAATDCSALAKWGIYDTSQTLTDEQRVNSFSHWFCSHKFASYGEAKSSSLELGIPIEDVP